MESRQWKMESQVGSLYLVASERGLEEVSWSRQKAKMISDISGSDRISRILRNTTSQLEEYFQRKRKSFDLPLAPEGTEFQKKVWKALCQIPYGKTFSYSDVAMKISNHKAVRAVGSANGKNPLSIIVPCHRVIAANGTLGGYAGGLDRKGMLLQLEGVSIGL